MQRVSAERPATKAFEIGALIALNAYWVPLALQDAALLAIAVPAALVHFDPATHRNTYAALVSLVALINTIVPPLAGALSDRLRKNGAGRRLFVFLGASLNAAGLLLIPGAASTQAFGAFLILASLGQTISTTAYQAMLPESVERSAWGIASGIRGAATLVGTVIGLAIAGFVSPNATFIATAVLTVIESLSLIAVQRGMNEEPEHAHIKDWHDFIVVFIARSFITFGLVLLMTFVLYFFRDVLHVSSASAGTGIVGFAALAGSAVSSIWLGRVSDRFERKSIVAACGVPMTLAALGFALFPNEHFIFGFALLFGLGFGGVLSTGWALAMDAIPQLGDVARDLGIWGSATHIPAVIAPIAGAAILAHFNGSMDGYRVLFACAAVTFAIGSFSVLAVRGATAKR
ncbi:MAG: MFS transporter [Vulcanimicrobiaceae bacterium]